MPTSGALDLVAKSLGKECYEVYFLNETSILNHKIHNQIKRLQPDGNFLVI
jgi:hypothetical protein